MSTNRFAEFDSPARAGMGQVHDSARCELKQLVANLVRDRRITAQAAWAAVRKGGVRRGPLNRLTRNELALAHGTLRELDATLPKGVAVAVADPEPTSCCRTVRDAYGAVTICTLRMRWCLGVAEHATRPNHTAANRSVTWDEGYTDEDELTEAAETAFVAADSRRK